LPSQVAVPLTGVGHAVHALVPQLLTLVLEAHRPLQSCVAAPQTASHALVF
jgi:hypothetical protein